VQLENAADRIENIITPCHFDRSEVAGAFGDGGRGHWDFGFTIYDFRFTVYDLDF
jgi:hypothetical protein